MLSDLQIIAYNRLMQVRLSILDNSLITPKTSSKSIIQLLLKNRHIHDLQTFLKPPFPKFKLPSKQLIDLVKTYLKEGKNILIYGDYDVDGLTSTALLWQTLYPLSSKVFPFIPHREIDGYGFRAQTFFNLQKTKKTNFDLLITVDNGIVADKEFAKVKAKFPKLKIIVIDHHLADGKLSHANFIYHSTQTCAAALAWFFCRQFTPCPSLALVALGVVADCQPLVDVNRALVVHGLNELRVNPSPGLKKILDLASIKAENVGVYELGFIIGPRLNATGRLADATDSLRLLCSQNHLQANKYAQILEAHNQTRQQLQQESLDIADKNIDLTQKLIFISGDFNPGVIGLISGRLTDKYSLPSIVISTQNEITKGSCRSISELNIIQTLRRFSNLFVDLGGHPGAAGFSILSKNIPLLKKKLLNYLSTYLKDYLPQKTITVDAKMDLNAVNLKNIKLINKLAPFGIGNPQPQFLFENCQINNIRTIGKNNDHLKLKVDGLDAICFKQAADFSYLKAGYSINFVARLDINEWQGHSFPQLIIQTILK